MSYPFLLAWCTVLVQPKHPEQSFPALPGKVIGILATGVEQQLKEEGRSGPPDAVYFARDKDHLRQPYVQDPSNSAGSQTLRVRIGGAGVQQKEYSAVRYLTLKRMQEKGYHGTVWLAELEVNDGLGSATDEHFVATRIIRLDGTRDYPFDLSTALENITQRFSQELDAKKDSISSEMRKAEKKYLNNLKPTGPEERTRFKKITWDTDKERIRVQMIQVVTTGAFSVGIGMAKQRDVQKKFGGTEGQRYGPQWGVRCSMTFLIERNGTVNQDQGLHLDTFGNELPPPK